MSKTRKWRNVCFTKISYTPKGQLKFQGDSSWRNSLVDQWGVLCLEEFDDGVAYIDFDLQEFDDDVLQTGEGRVSMSVDRLTLTTRNSIYEFSLKEAYEIPVT